MTIPVQLRIEEDQFEHVKRTARLLAATEDRDVDWRDLLREAIAEKFPMPRDERDETQGRLQE